jgi:hypothetical protein
VAQFFSPLVFGGLNFLRPKSALFVFVDFAGCEGVSIMVLLRRHIILGLMCNFAIDFDSIAIDAEKLFKDEWKQLSNLEAEGLLTLGSNNVSVNERGRWLVRVIAAVFDPDTQQKPSGSRLV